VDFLSYFSFTQMQFKIHFHVGWRCGSDSLDSFYTWHVQCGSKL